MTEKTLVDTIVEELRTMAQSGDSASSLLRRIQQLTGKTHCELLSVQCFHKAFGGGVAAVSPIGGWAGFGAELMDSQIDAFLAPVLEGYRKGTS